MTIRKYYPGEPETETYWLIQERIGGEWRDARMYKVESYARRCYNKLLRDNECTEYRLVYVEKKFTEIANSLEDGE